MSLKTILATKASEVVSIDFTADLAAAAKLLTKHRIGALVVLGVGGRLAGILSERDIVRTMAESGTAVLHLPVAQVMTRNVSTCDVNDSMDSVIHRMTKGKFRHMPVLDNDRLAGMISIGDVLKWHIETIRSHIHQLEASIAEFDIDFSIEQVPSSLPAAPDKGIEMKSHLRLAAF
jgi:CBS domain-containing protein